MGKNDIINYWQNKMLKYNEYNLEVSDFFVSKFTKRILSEIGLPVTGLSYSLILHPITNLSISTINKRKFYLIADFGSFLFLKKYLAFELNEGTDKVYLVSLKKEKIELVNSNLLSFLSFFTSFNFFVEKYQGKKKQKGKINAKEIAEDYSNLKIKMEKEDEIGFGSKFWKESLYELRNELGDYFPDSLYNRFGGVDTLDFPDSDEPF